MVILGAVQPVRNSPVHPIGQYLLHCAVRLLPCHQLDGRSGMDQQYEAGEHGMAKEKLKAEK